jgi:hypothetical protein
MRNLGIALGLNQGGSLEVVLAAGNGAGPAALWHGEVRPFWNGSMPLGQPAGGALSCGPAVAANADGRLEAAVIGNDLAVWRAWQSRPGQDWTSWQLLGQPGGEPVISRMQVPAPAVPSAVPVDPTPVLASNADGRLEVFVVGADQSIWHCGQTQPNGDWSDWSDWAPLGLPGAGTMGPLTVASNADGRLELFTVAILGAVWHCGQTQPNGDWSDWESMDFPHEAELGGLAAARNQDGRLELFVVGQGGVLWHRWQTQPGGSWSDWRSLDTRGAGFAGVAAAPGPAGRLVIFATEQPTGTSTGGHNSGELLWQRSQLTPGGAWSPWESWKRMLSLGQAGPLRLPGLIQTPVLAADYETQLGLYLWVSKGTELYQYVLFGVDPAKQSEWGGGSLRFATS